MKSTTFKRLATVAAAVSLVALLTLAGCGYHLGDITNPQLRSIAIAPIDNDTYEPNASAYMRESLAEQFQVDNSLKVKSLQTADCVLYGRITKVDVDASDRESSNDGQMFRASEFQMNVYFEFVVIIPGRAEPVITRREVVGMSHYQYIVDDNMTRAAGLRQACRDAAKQAVINTVEAW